MNAFSKTNPDLQIVWDASSLKAYQFCPRYYQYSNLEGWRGNSTDLEFGGYVASGFERFQKARISGKSIDDALLEVVRWALEATYFEAEHCTLGMGCDETGVCFAGAHDQPDQCGREGTQWGGRYETMWKCTGEKPYRNAKGNKALCPFSHKRAWFPLEAPSICGECGSPTRTERRYIAHSSTKNRHTLLRLLIWYGLSQPENLEDGYRPFVFPNGTPAVELSDRIPLPFKTLDKEQFFLSWNFDYIGQWGNELFITDNKTTTKTLDGKYFASFSPDTQFDTYALAAKVAYPTLPIKGVMVDAAQTLVGGAEFGKHPYYKTDDQLEEHLDDLEHWIKDAEQAARKGYWKMNKRNCWLCGFKQTCSLPRAQRKAHLETNFTKRPRWDPLQER